MVVRVWVDVGRGEDVSGCGNDEGRHTTSSRCITTFTCRSFTVPSLTWRLCVVLRAFINSNKVLMYTTREVNESIKMKIM